MISRILNKEVLKLSLIVLLALIRLINLDADPGIFKRVGDIHDEGYWGSNARNLVLYDQFITDEANLGAAMAPLYTLFTFFFFILFGVSNYTLRLPSAVFGILTILFSYFFLKKYNKDIAFWGSLFLALNYQYFTFNRIGHVETLQSFFILLTFFFLERKSWFAGGLSYGLVVSAKYSGILFFPAIILYFLFMFIRKEISLKYIFYFASGCLIIGLGWIAYQWYFWDSFQVTHQHIGDRFPFSNIKNLFLSLFNQSVSINRNAYLANPVSIFLLVCFIIYLIQIRFYNIVRKNLLSYIKGLNNLDIIVISWIFGYAGALYLAGNLGSERRLNLISVVLSFIPAIILFKKDKFEYYHPEMSGIKIFISLIPLVFLGRELASYFLPLTHNTLTDTLRFLLLHRQEPAPISYLQDNVLIGMAVSLLLITALSFWHKHLSHKTKKRLIEISIISLILVINLSSVFHLTALFLLSKYLTLFFLLLISALFLFIFYLISRNWNSIKILYAISLSLILVTLFTPQFTVRDASLKLAQSTSEQDYIIGFKGHLLSYNARYYPVWWWPPYDNLNSEFIKKVKPGYFFFRTKEYGKEDIEWIMSKEETLQRIGASDWEKVYSFGLFPVFGRYGEEYALYRIVY